MDNLRVVKVDSETLTFQDGTKLFSDHDSDCCESHYLDFSDLTIEDFELFENYEHQKIEALYLIRKTNIEREEALKRFNPALTRHFYLIFQITDYNPRFAEASGHLFNQVLLPGDTLTIMTPMDLSLIHI